MWQGIWQPPSNGEHLGPLMPWLDRSFTKRLGWAYWLGSDIQTPAGKFIGLEMSIWQRAAPEDPAIPPGRLQTWIWQRDRNPQQRQDAALRWAFVVELEGSFAHVETYDNDIVLTRAYLQLFGERALWPEAQGVGLA